MTKTRITALDALDVRFPTSDRNDGSDAVHVDPDYSAAYVVLRTDRSLEGHGLAFTIGRGNEIVVEALRSLAPLVVGRTLEEIEDDWAGFWRLLVNDSQMRWIGPEKGVVHLAVAAVVNAVWDLSARKAKKPLWKLVTDLRPKELVRCIDFRYIDDALSSDEALAMLERNAKTKKLRERDLAANGYPAYTTSVGWLGYSDAKITKLARAALREGWTHFKMKVGADLDDDVRRAKLLRRELGPGRRLMMDANQRWSVHEAIANMKELTRFSPWWIEEPTSPDDVLGHAAIAKAVAPIGVATGEQCANRVVFKQLLQANAISFCQIDACRLGGVNENLAVMLMAAKFGVPVCPHAGGVGLCEHVNHLAFVDYVVVSGSLERRVAEYVDHLHEHFVDPCVIERAAYTMPTAPGYSVRMKPLSLQAFAYPNGPVWSQRRARVRVPAKRARRSTR